MPITQNQYFGSGGPQWQADIKRGLNNIADLFLPPSQDELATYSTIRDHNAHARLDEDQAARLRALDALAQQQSPGFNKDEWDRMAVAAGRGSIANGYYGVDQGNATDLAKNALDNKTRFLTTRFGPLNQGQVEPIFPEHIAKQLGLPAMDAVAGAPKPLSETEWQAGQNQRLLDTGQLTDQDLIDKINGADTPVKVLGGPDGKTPVFSTPGAAVRTGALVAPTPPSTVINNGGENAYDKTYNENLAKGAIALQDDAQSARGTLNTVSQMRNLMSDPNFYSGPAAQQIQVAKQIAATLGLTVADGAAPMEAFNALSNQLIKDGIGGSLGNQISDADRQFVARTQANLGNTREGNEALLNVAEKLAQRKIETAQWADEYASQHNGRLDAGWNAFLDAKAKANPLFPPSEPGTAPSGQFTEGQTAINKATGQRLVFRGGQWTPVP